MHCEVLACTDQTRLRGTASFAGKTAEAMVNIKQARIALHVVAVLMAVTAVATAFQNSHSCSNRPTLGFVGPSIAPGLAATRSDAAAAAAAAIKCGLAKTPAAQQQSTSAESPLARRMLLRKARSRPTTASTTTASPQRQHREAEERAAEKGGGDVGDLFRMEVALRMKEVKLMTQPGVGLLPPADSRSGSSVLAAAAPKLDGDAAALESQIALLTKRIESIANHLQTTPTDAVSRKGLVVLVKRRRCLLETLRHRDNARWLATTESLGLRQRPDVAASTEEQLAMAARRARRRDRGRRRRQDDARDAEQR